MGSMVPLEVSAAREEPPPPRSDALDSYRGSRAAAPAPTPAAGALMHYDVPPGWTHAVVDATSADVVHLRDALLKHSTGQRLTLLVTGATRPELSQVACGLSLALAQSGASTLLVEADFDNPQIHRLLSVNIAPGAGFSQQLMARRHAKAPEPWVVMRCTANLNVLAEGRFRSPGLVSSKEFEQALGYLGEQHHLVIIHAPPLSQADDLRALAALVQASVVVQAGQPSRLAFGAQSLAGALG